MLRVGLTGGIASGKTSISRLFEKLGVPVIDTDLLARELVEPGTPLLDVICDTFGRELLQPDGNLNRAAVRKLVFADEKKREQLEDILHPAIRDLTSERLSALDADYAIVVIPLLVESRHPIPVDRVLVVDTTEENQLERLVKRDAIDRTQAEAILRAQTDRQTRLAIADEVICNDADVESLRGQVERLHAFYLGIAGQELADPA